MRRVAINADAEPRSSTLRDERNGAECNSFYGNPDPATKEKAPISYESNCSISTRSCPQPYHQRSLSYPGNHPPCVTRLSIRHGKRSQPVPGARPGTREHDSRLTTLSLKHWRLQRPQNRSARITNTNENPYQASCHRGPRCFPHRAKNSKARPVPHTLEAGKAGLHGKSAALQLNSSPTTTQTVGCDECAQ